ncbi:hypothetical protein [Luethyella okanaganae]|uniref:Uncharacterized protein n=1 Tax=Luethyella okanaganae TaxID=69372 RepID=A0ABW1VDG7_9MICO
MTNAEPQSVLYIAEFIDGPLEGETERRVLLGGTFEERVGMVAAVEGLESLFWYNAIDSREVQGQLHVRYRFDRGDSDPVEASEEND